MCCQWSRLPAKLAHLRVVIRACAYRCSISDTIPADGEDAARRIQRPCQELLLDRSSVPHIRLAKAIVAAVDRSGVPTARGQRMKMSP